MQQAPLGDSTFQRLRHHHHRVITHIVMQGAAGRNMNMKHKLGSFFSIGTEIRGASRVRAPGSPWKVRDKTQIALFSWLQLSRQPVAAGDVSVSLHPFELASSTPHQRKRPP